jgi:hypothetical protein
MSRSIAFTIAAALAFAALPRAASAESLIHHPGVHPGYRVELEPHFLVQLAEPPHLQTGSAPGFGGGARVAIELIDNGPIPSINNTMALGFGFDWAHFERGGRCRGIDCEDTSVDHLYFPVVIQWNFWLSESWSVFGEPGLAYRYSPQTEDRLDTFVLSGGGRWHFSERATATLRIGYPAATAGFSFLL